MRTMSVLLASYPAKPALDLQALATLAMPTKPTQSGTMINVSNLLPVPSAIM